MEFFKPKHVAQLKKLKEDSVMLRNTMAYVDEQLCNPREIFDQRQVWPTKQKLMEELAKVKMLQNDVQTLLKSARANSHEIRKLKSEVGRGVADLTQEVNHLEAQLVKYGMSPIPLVDCEKN